MDTIRTLINPRTDFLILTETKAIKNHVEKCKFKIKGATVALIPTMCTDAIGASGGVGVFSSNRHELLENSMRESLRLGHYVVGVYKVGVHHVIVGGIYGLPDHNDIQSAAIFENLINDVRELQNLFPVQNVLLAGDFNCVLSEKDSHMNKILKPRTNEVLR